MSKLVFIFLGFLISLPASAYDTDCDTYNALKARPTIVGNRKVKTVSSLQCSKKTESECKCLMAFPGDNAPIFDALVAEIIKLPSNGTSKSEIKDAGNFRCERRTFLGEKSGSQTICFFNEGSYLPQVEPPSEIVR